MLSEHIWSINDLPINYAEGPADGPPLVMIHGLTGRWQGLRPLIPALLPAWHVYACDLRGHGKSGRRAHQYRLTDYAGDLVAFLGNVVREPAVLVGHSLGALVALAATSHTADHVAALVLLDPPLLSCTTSIEATPQFRDWFRWVYTAREAPLSQAEVVTQLRTMAPTAEEAILMEIADTVACVAPDTVLLALQDRVFDGFDLERTLQQIRCPLLLIRGEWQCGSAVRDEDAALVRACVPHAVDVKLPQASHQLHVEQTDAVLKAMMTFFRAGAAATRS